MSVLKNKRNKTKFEVFTHFMKLRSDITSFMFFKFGFKPIKIRVDAIEEEIQKIEKVNQFREWFIEEEKNKIFAILQDISQYITMANSIFPTYISECDQQREYQNIAIGLCFDLLQELQYVAITAKIDINKFEKYCDAIEKEVALLKGWRRSGNKIRQRIEGI